MDPQRQHFKNLIDILAKCPDPYGAAQVVLGSLFEDIRDLSREMGSFLDDLVALARVNQCPLPESVVEDIRDDLEEMTGLPRKFGVLFSEQTKAKCGRSAVPLLAAAIMSTNNWVEFAYEWLFGVERIRIRTDALLCRLARDRESD